MKNKKIILGVLTFGMLVASVPTVAFAMNGIEKSLEVKEESLKKVGKEKVNSIQKNLDKLERDNSDDEAKIKKLTDEREKTEIEYNLFDYKEEIKMRIGTVKAAIIDMKSSLERGVNEKEKKDCNNRIKALKPIVKKYEIILTNESDTEDYKKLASELNEELSKIYDKIN